jgi:hypothetical protein
MAGIDGIELAEYDTDKRRAYLDNYEREIGHLFDQPGRLLELGVQRGGSMLLWRDLFPQGQIAGLDLNDVTVPDESGRIHIYKGYQQDPKVLDHIAAEMAPDGFDVIIDDASHVGEYTAASFWHLFPNHLKPGGIYVIDDWSCGYWSHWPDGHEYCGSRAALGESTEDSHPTPQRMEAVRRRVRASARPVATWLERFPFLKGKLRDLYMRSEGVSLQRRFPSHDYGMVGFVKQLVDAVAIDVINAPKGKGSAAVSTAQIARVHVTASQVFVHKVGAWEPSGLSRAT